MSGFPGEHLQGIPGWALHGGPQTAPHQRRMPSPGPQPPVPPPGARGTSAPPGPAPGLGPAPAGLPPRPPHWLREPGAAPSRTAPRPRSHINGRGGPAAGGGTGGCKMPRSFLVKKHFSASKKPNYSELESQTGACCAGPPPPTAWGCCTARGRLCPRGGERPGGFLPASGRLVLLIATGGLVSGVSRASCPRGLPLWGGWGSGDATPGAFPMGWVRCGPRNAGWAGAPSDTSLAFGC